MSASLLPWAISFYYGAAVETRQERSREPRADTVAGSPNLGTLTAVASLGSQL